MGSTESFSIAVSEALDLFIWDRSPLSFHFPRNPSHLAFAVSLGALHRLDHADKCIAAKQGNFHSPAGRSIGCLLQQRQKCADSAFLELWADPFLMPRHRMNCEPLGFISSNPTGREVRCRFGVSVDCTQLRPLSPIWEDRSSNPFEINLTLDPAP